MKLHIIIFYWGRRLKPGSIPGDTVIFKISVNSIVGRATLKMLCRKSKTQFVKQERNTQNVIPLLN
jgi:hypothetical protein